MKESRKSAHSPGAQGHDETMRNQISKLQEQHSSMVGNQHNPDYDEQVGQRGLTERLYQEQSPKDYQNREITKHKQGRNKSDIHEWPPNPRKKSKPRRGDVGGKGSY